MYPYQMSVGSAFSALSSVSVKTLEGRYWDWQCSSSKEPEFLRYLSDQVRNKPEMSTFDFISPRNKLLL